MSEFVVRRLELQDLEARVEWFNSPSVYRYMSIEVPMSLADTELWFANSRQNPQRRDFVVLLRDDGQESPVAMCGLTSIDSRSRNAELYIMADPERQGRGYGTIAVTWLCNYGFCELGLYRIYLTVLAHNARARRLYERLGFALEGTLRHHVYCGGAYCDRLLFGSCAPSGSRCPGPLRPYRSC